MNGVVRVGCRVRVIGTPADGAIGVVDLDLRPERWRVLLVAPSEFRGRVGFFAERYLEVVEGQDGDHAHDR